MPFDQSLEREKPWFLMASLGILTLFAVACFEIRDATAPDGAMASAAGPSLRTEVEQVPSNAAEAAPAPLAQAPAAQPPAARVPAAQALAEQLPEEPAALHQDPDEPTADAMSASEQSTLKARRALETIDPRELLR